MVFTCIDPSDLDRVFYFSVKINSDGTYTGKSSIQDQQD